MFGRLKSRRGFSLIEALAAFAILAMSLGQLLNGVSGGVRNEARADFLQRASREGASHLEALGVDGPVPFGQTSGRYPDGLYWFLTVTPGPNAMGPSGQPLATSFHAELVIKKPSGFGETFTLSTLKIKPVAQQGQ
jgi:type II secretory pathway pseudopilin PulG